jgi:hypothetical protein
MAKGWSCEFDEPIDRPDGRTPVTLEDAGNYITKLPKAEHMAPERRDAIQALMIVARGGPTMFARIGVLRRFTATLSGRGPAKFTLHRPYADLEKAARKPRRERPGSADNAKRRP